MARSKNAAMSVIDAEGNPLPNVQEDGTVQVLTGGVVNEPDLIEEDDPLANAIQELGASGDDGRVEIWRVKRTLQGTQEAFVSPMALEDFSIARVQQLYGGGHFRVVVKNQRGKIVKRGSLQIDGDPIMTQRQQAPQSALPVPYPPQGEDSPLMRSIGALMQQNNQILQLLAQNVQHDRPIQKSTVEFAQELLTIKSLFQAPGGDPIDMMTKTINLMKEMGVAGNGGGETTEMDLFKSLIEKFGPAFMAGMQKDAAENSALQNMLPTPAPSFNNSPNLQPQPQPQPNPAHRPQPATDPEMLKLKMALHFLCSKAKAGTDPETYADVVLDEVGENDTDFTNLINDPQWLEKLSVFVPDVRVYSTWFTQLRESIIAQLTPIPEAGTHAEDSTPPE